MTIGSLGIEATVGGEKTGAGGMGSRGTGVLAGLVRWIELVIFPLVMVVQREEEIRIARLKCERRFPC